MVVAGPALPALAGDDDVSARDWPGGKWSFRLPPGIAKHLGNWMNLKDWQPVWFQYQGQWYCILLPPWWQPGDPEPKPADLVAELKQDGDDPYRLVFTVTNRGGREAELRFSNGQRFDLTLEQGGKTVWRASEGRMYIEAAGQEKVAPGDSLSYTVELPRTLNRGEYQATAWVTAGNWDDIRARKRVTLPGWSWGIDALELSLRISDRGFDGRPGAYRAVVDISNPSRHDVYLDSRDAVYRVRVLDAGGREVWSRQGATYTGDGRTDVFEAGERRTYFIALPKLADGRYTVEAGFGAAGRLVERATLRVR